MSFLFSLRGGRDGAIGGGLTDGVIGSDGENEEGSKGLVSRLKTGMDEKVFSDGGCCLYSWAM